MIKRRKGLHILSTDVVFYKDIFNPSLVESSDMEPMNMKDPLCFHMHHKLLKA